MNKKLRKGRILVFKDRTETIIKGSDNRLSGTVKTDKQEYSTDFLYRWLELGFVTVKEQKKK